MTPSTPMPDTMKGRETEKDDAVKGRQLKPMIFTQYEKDHIGVGLVRGPLSIRKIWNNREREVQYQVRCGRNLLSRTRYFFHALHFTNASNLAALSRQEAQG